MNTFIMCQYYIITKLETIKIGYRQELHDRSMKQYREMEISEQQIADQRRAIVTKGLLSRPWLKKQSLKRLNLHPNTYIQMQKSVILGTCSVVRNFLNYK
jgi:hypothetical protein